MRAGNLATPANAMPSSSTSSSGSTLPRPCISARNASCTASASSSGWPITRSVITDVAAWLIEQPSASYDTSSTTARRRRRCTRRVISSPQVGLTWCTSASNGLPQARVVRVLVVVQDDLLVQRVEIHGQSTLKYFLVYSNPSMSASISAGVV